MGERRKEVWDIFAHAALSPLNTTIPRVCWENTCLSSNTTKPSISLLLADGSAPHIVFQLFPYKLQSLPQPHFITLICSPIIIIMPIRVYCQPGTVLGSLHVLSHLILMTALSSQHCYSLHKLLRFLLHGTTEATLALGGHPYACHQVPRQALARVAGSKRDDLAVRFKNKAALPRIVASPWAGAATETHADPRRDSSGTSTGCFHPPQRAPLREGLGAPRVETVYIARV